MKGGARAAAVHQRPFAVGAHADRDRLHRASAIGGAVAGRGRVEMPAPQAARTVVSMFGAGRVHRDVEPAVAATEAGLVPPPRAVALLARQVGPPEVVRERKTGVA